MAFINPLVPKNYPSVGNTNNFYNSPGSGLSGRGFATSFPKGFGPAVKVDVNLQLGGISTRLGARKGESNSNGDGGNNNNNNGNSNKGGNKKGDQPKRAHKKARGGHYEQPDRGSTVLNFSSGVKSGIIVNSFESCRENFSSLFLQCGSLFDFGQSDPFAKEAMTTYIYMEYLSAIQVAVNVKADQDFKEDAFFRYFAKLCNALELYYMIDSLLAYCNNSSIQTKNRGMLYLRSKIDAKLLSKHAELGATIVQYPLPPKLVNFVRYMYQNFKFGAEEGLPIYKLGFRSCFHNAGDKLSLSEHLYDVIMDELNTYDKDRDAFNRLQSLLFKVFPSTKFQSLPLSSKDVIYDKNFLSFWSNNTNTYVNKGDKSEVKYTRHVADLGDRYYYNMFGDDVDGLFYASQAIYCTKTGTVESGIWKPITDDSAFAAFPLNQKSSLLCYKDFPDRLEAFTSKGDCIQSGTFHSVYFAFSEDKKNYETIGVVGTPVGSVRIQSNSQVELRQPISLSIRHLFDVSSAASEGAE